MAKLLIWGHATRGQEVIKILEMLGGKNTNGYVGDASYSAYSINEQGTIDNHMFIRSPFVAIFTLEEFLEKFPYKIGDKVVWNKDNKIWKIVNIKWDENKGCYELYRNEWFAHAYVNELQPYKEETMKETVIDTIKESEDRYQIKVNYQFDIEVDEGEYYVVRRKPQYPKTYKECCDVLSLPLYYNLRYHTYEHYYSEFTTNIKLRSLEDKLNTLGKLVICRYAYWKIAGDWKPDWCNHDQKKYCIYYCNNAIKKDVLCAANTILAFPTKEMADTFYENFKNLIEQCKGFLC